MKNQIIGEKKNWQDEVEGLGIHALLTVSEIVWPNVSEQPARTATHRASTLPSNIS